MWYGESPLFYKEGERSESGSTKLLRRHGTLSVTPLPSRPSGGRLVVLVFLLLGLVFLLKGLVLNLMNCCRILALPATNRILAYAEARRPRRSLLNFLGWIDVDLLSVKVCKNGDASGFLEYPLLIDVIYIFLYNVALSLSNLIYI